MNKALDLPVSRSLFRFSLLIERIYCKKNIVDTVFLENGQIYFYVIHLAIENTNYLSEGCKLSFTTI